jgi:putative FmdB family regulatory protein
MPTIEYKCGNCGHLFKAVVFRGDPEAELSCPKCHSPSTKSLSRSESLFKEISNFSTFAKDTN